MDDGKKTVELPGMRPEEKKTVEVATLPIILQEMRDFRGERREHDTRTDKQFELLHSQVATLDGGVKTLAIQVQTNFEVQNAKIRDGQQRAESLEARARALEAFKNATELELKTIRDELSRLKGVAPADLDNAVKKQVSLSEDQMTKKLDLEAQERAAVETKVDMLSTMLVQALGLRPPPAPLPDGSMPPTDGKKKREPKNAIEKQTFWAKAAAVMGGVVVMAGTLDKMGTFKELGKLASKLLGH